MKCLEKIIGLTLNDCNCYEEDGSASFSNISYSGYYLDDSEDGITLPALDALKECGDNGLWQMMDNARREGINEFLTDFKVTVDKENEPRYRRFTGTIGQRGGKEIIDAAAGWIITPKCVKGSELILREIGVSFYEDSMQDDSWFISLYKWNEGWEFINSLPTGVQAKKGVVWQDADWALPLTDHYGEPIVYLLMVEDLADRLANNKISCGCGGGKELWMNYVNIQGVSDRNGGELRKHEKGDKYNHGLMLKADISCSGMTWLCAGESEYKREAFYKAVAKTIQYYAVNKLIGKILNSGNVNRYTLMQREHLYGKRNHNRKEIEAHLEYLANHLPVEDVDCWICRNKHGLTKNSILV